MTDDKTMSIYKEFGLKKGIGLAVHIHTYSIVQYRCILDLTGD